jgi:hypothetical protein
MADSGGGGLRWPPSWSTSAIVAPRKVAKQNTNIQFLELDLHRSHFTSHGMHMNSKGKDQSSQHLAQLFDLIFYLPQPPPYRTPGN